jgi:hypothetical protein
MYNYSKCVLCGQKSFAQITGPYCAYCLAEMAENEEYNEFGD